MAGVPYTFAGASTTIPLSQLDANFQTPITIGATNMNLGQVVTTISGLTLANVNITSGNVTISNINVTNVTTGNATITGGVISNTTLTNVTITSLATTLPNNFLANSSVTIGNTSVALGGTITNVGNLTLINATISSISTTFPNNFLSNNSLTIGNTTVALGGSAANIGNVTFANVTVNSVSTPITAAQGGTNVSSITANAVIIGNGTSSIQTVSPGTAGNVLTSNGTNWISQTGGAVTNISSGTSNVAIVSANGNVTSYVNGVLQSTLFSGGLSLTGSLVLAGNTSGSLTVNVPAVAGTNTATFPAVTGTVMVSGNMPAFSAYQSSTQTLSSSTTTKITFTTKEFDTNNNFASSTFTPTVAGYYQINASVAWSTNNYLTVAYIYKNGSNNKSGVQGVNGICTVNSLIYLNGSTDYVEIYAFTITSQGTAIGLAATYFNACLVRGA